MCAPDDGFYEPDAVAFRQRQAQDRRAATPEPAPTGDGAIVLDYVRAKINGASYLFPLDARVLADLEARAEFGRKKYGTLLRTNNGRNPIVDMYQEVLDAVMYSAQCRMQGLHAGTFLETFMNLAKLIVAEIAKQERNDAKESIS